MVNSCGVIPVYYDGRRWRILLIQNRNHKWGFPRGTMEVGETKEQTARRELREEVGLTAIELLPDPQFYERFPFRHFGRKGKKTVKEITYWLGYAKKTGVRPHPVEVLDIHWFDFPTARRVLELPNTKRILQEVSTQLFQRRVWPITKPKK